MGGGGWGWVDSEIQGRASERRMEKERAVKGIETERNGEERERERERERELSLIHI